MGDVRVETGDGVGEIIQSDATGGVGMLAATHLVAEAAQSALV